MGRQEREIAVLRGLNPVTLLPIIILFICVPLLTVLSSTFRSPFSFGRPTFSQGLSEEDLKSEFASRVDWKDIGEEAALTSGPSQDQISLASDAFEFESSSESTSFKVGSLKTHVEFWSNSVQASDFIIRTIVDGYRIPFFDLPGSYSIPNRSSAFKFKDFVNEAISELIERGCVIEVDIPPVFINPLHVVQQSSGKCRLILDLSYLTSSFGSSRFDMKIFVLCLTYFYRAIFSSLSISNPVIITLKYFLIIVNISVFLGDLILSSNILFSRFCLLACRQRLIFLPS